MTASLIDTHHYHQIDAGRLEDAASSSYCCLLDLSFSRRTAHFGYDLTVSRTIRGLRGKEARPTFVPADASATRSPHNLKRLVARFLAKLSLIHQSIYALLGSLKQVARSHFNSTSIPSQAQSARMSVTITDFDFGVAGDYPVPLTQPDPGDHVAYTIWHVSRALAYHQANSNHTIEPILRKISSVSSLPSPASLAFSWIRPTDIQQTLKVQRPIQPLQRFRRGVLVNFGPCEPQRTEHAAAILLYVLLPGYESEKCSACKAHAGN